MTLAYAVEEIRVAESGHSQVAIATLGEVPTLRTTQRNDREFGMAVRASASDWGHRPRDALGEPTDACAEVPGAPRFGGLRPGCSPEDRNSSNTQICQSLYWQYHGLKEAAFGAICERDVAAMAADDGSRYGEPESCATGLTAAGGFDPIKGPEDLLEL